MLLYSYKATKKNSVHVEVNLRNEGFKFVVEVKSTALKDSVSLTVLYLQLDEGLTLSKFNEVDFTLK
jgi:hypothetical protein